MKARRAEDGSLNTCYDYVNQVKIENLLSSVSERDEQQREIHIRKSS